MTVFTRRSDKVGRMSGGVIAVLALLLALGLTVTHNPVAAQDPQPGLRIGDPGYGQTITAGMVTSIVFYLRTEPTASVSVRPSSPSPNVTTHGPWNGVAYFTVKEWNRRGIVQVFTYPGADKDEGAGNITLTVSSDDADYDGLTQTVPITIVGANPKCSNPTKPKVLTVERTPSSGAISDYMVHVVPEEAWCAGIAIIKYMVLVQQNDGPWKLRHNVIGAYPWDWRWPDSVSPSGNWLYAEAGDTWRVRSIGFTWSKGSTPWSPILEVNVPSLPDPPGSTSGQQISGGSADTNEEVPGAVLNLSVRQTGNKRIRVEWDAPEAGGAVGKYEVTLVRDGKELSKRRPGAKKTHVVIRRLDPGATYTINVKASNAHGFGAERTAQITLRAAEQ